MADASDGWAAAGIRRVNGGAQLFGMSEQLARKQGAQMCKHETIEAIDAVFKERITLGLSKQNALLVWCERCKSNVVYMITFEGYRHSLANMVEAKPAAPRYRCHKEVVAYKIEAISVSAAGDKVFLNTEEGTTITVPTEYLHKHMAFAGGYYVRYDDGYESYSPAAAFESGYTRI